MTGGREWMKGHRRRERPATETDLPEWLTEAIRHRFAALVKPRLERLPELAPRIVGHNAAEIREVLRVEIERALRETWTQIADEFGLDLDPSLFDMKGPTEE